MEFFLTPWGPLKTDPGLDVFSALRSADGGIHLKPRPCDECDVRTSVGQRVIEEEERTLGSQRAAKKSENRRLVVRCDRLGVDLVPCSPSSA